LKLFIASAFVLGLLFVMLFTLVFTFFYVFGMIPWYWLIAITLVVNFLTWLVGPYISDWVFAFFYKLKWIGIEGLEKRDKNIAAFVREVCSKNNIKVPKIGYIDDDNPTSFTYGSAAFNARIVYTEGIFTYLDREEAKSVFAHELGHVVHRDFIILTIAAVFVQLFYQLYRIGMQSGERGGKKKGGTAILAIVGYIFYVVGNYIVLYLSRLREYYADEFAAEHTNNPNALSNALVKIAYGIIQNPEKKQQLHLLKSTRSQNIFDFKIAKRIGLAYANASTSKNWKPVEGALLYDRYNPWATISELSSTLGQKPLFDMKTLYTRYNVDKARLYKNFGRDVLFLYMPLLLCVILPVTYVAITTALFTAFNVVYFLANILNIFALFILGLGLGYLIKTLYSYSTATGFPQTTIADLMGDIYTSPVRGKPAAIKGKVVGRGIAGLIFSEDMMYQDSTGLVYLNYEGLIPMLGNLIFAFTKVDKLVGKESRIEGWFVRSIYQMVHLNKIYVDGKEIKSRVRLLGMIMSGLFIIIGLFLFMLGSSYAISLA